MTQGGKALIIDFVRDGQPGDEVWEPSLGNGTITKITAQPGTVHVDFPTCNPDLIYPMTFDRYGGINDEARPTLCWGHRDPLDQGSPPQRQ